MVCNLHKCYNYSHFDYTSKLETTLNSLQTKEGFKTYRYTDLVV